MKGLDKNNGFEEEWRKSFADAEAEPSEELWTKIDAVLANNDATKYRKKAVYYKYVAAAAVLIAAFLGVLVMTLPENELQPLSEQTPNSSSFEKDQPTAITDNKNPGMSTPKDQPSLTQGPSNDVMHDGSSGNSGQQNSMLSDETLTGGDVADNRKFLQKETDVAPLAVVPVDKDKELLLDEEILHYEQDFIDRQDMNVVVLNENPSLIMAEKRGIAPLEADLKPGYTHINKVMDLSDFYAMTRPAKENRSGMWAGVSFSGGNFNPDYSASSTSTMDYAELNSPVPTYTPVSRDAWNDHIGNKFYSEAEEKDFVNYMANTTNKENEPGISYTVGLNMGTRISQKFVLQSGLFYAKKTSSTSTSSIAIDENNEAYPMHFTNVARMDQSYYNVNYPAEISLNNSFQFISIPLKLGYHIVDEKVGVIVYSGVSSEFFLNNKIDDGKDGLNAVNVKRGSDSPYRNVWFNGLVSLELKYNFGGFYSAFIEPSYKISLNSLTKSDFAVKSEPKSFNIGMGVKINIQ